MQQSANTMTAFAFLVTSLLVAICNAKTYNTIFNNVTWDDTNWRLTTTVLDQGHYQSRMSLANGYLGINVAAAGPFFEVDTPVNGDNIGGWPLFDRRQTFATIAGFYASEPDTNGTNFPWLLQYGGESVIAGIPHWSGLLVETSGHVLNASVPGGQISNFNSTLDMKKGLKSWTYTWSPPDGPALDIQYRMLVHKLHVNMAAVEISIAAKDDANVTVIDVFDGDCAVRSDFDDSGITADKGQIWSAVRPHWVGNVTAYVFSTLTGDDSLDISTRARYNDSAYIGGNASSIAQAATVQLSGGRTSVITKFVGAASSDAFKDPRATALKASQSAATLGFDVLLQANADEWAELMPDDSVDNYAFPDNDTLVQDSNIITLQITAVTNPWNLIQNTVGSNAIKAAGNNTKLDIWSISVGGLGSSAYAGWIFWDAEVWMAPGLVVANPQAAKQIANYRLQLFPQAKANVNDSYQGSTNVTTFTPGGAAYPWVSGRYGNCTAAGPCFDYEYHLNGDIGLELYNWYVTTGDSETFKNDFFPIYDAVAHFYSELLFYNSTNDKYELLNATDPVSTFGIMYKMQNS
jgi:trehalose/maltose hydrolase-like predicted phosphorylase